MNAVWLAISGLAYASVWVLYLASPGRRSFRSIAFLVVTSGILWIALLWTPSLAWPFSEWFLIGGVGGLWAAGLWDLGHLLAPMPRPEIEFDIALGRIRDRVLHERRSLSVESWQREADRHVRSLEGALRDVLALVPPGDDWQRLQTAAATALQFDIGTFTGRRSLNSATASASQARWEALSREWADVRSRRSRFWR